MKTEKILLERVCYVGLVPYHSIEESLLRKTTVDYVAVNWVKPLRSIMVIGHVVIPRVFLQGLPRLTIKTSVIRISVHWSNIVVYPLVVGVIDI